MHLAGSCFDAQFNFGVLTLNDKLYHVSVLYNASIGIGCLNNGVQLKSSGYRSLQKPH